MTSTILTMSNGKGIDDPTAEHCMTLFVPEALHPETKHLVKAFAEELARKLRADELKHGFRNEWATDLWEDQCRNDLFKHLLKGDPRDVAAYCAFMWKRGWRIFAATMESKI